MFELSRIKIKDFSERRQASPAIYHTLNINTKLTDNKKKYYTNIYSKLIQNIIII